MKSSRDSISHSNENEKYLTKEIKFGDKNFKVYQLFCKEENNAELSDGFQQTRSNRKKESKRKVQVEGDPNDARSLLLELVSLREKSTKVNNIFN